MPGSKSSCSTSTPGRSIRSSRGSKRSEERRVGKECRSLCDWSSDVCSSDLYRFSRWALRKLNARKQEFVFYIHPWEVDPEQPRVEEAGALSRFRHYLNLDRCAARLGRLLDDFEFDTMYSVLAQRNLLPAQ